MAFETYTYSKSADFPGGLITEEHLDEEIRASGIETALDGIAVDGDAVGITFKATLSVGNKTILDGDTAGPAGGLIAATDTSAYTSADAVHVVGDGPRGPMGETRVYDPPNRPGFYSNNRDIRLRTAKITDSFTDNGQNLTTFKQEPWNEITLYGVKKIDGNGDYVDCTDDGDAALNAVLSIWDIHPHDHSDPDPALCNIIPIDLMGGRVHVDPILESPTEEHVFYAIAMPEVPGAYGGKIPFFDAYMDREKILESINSKAIAMDPINQLDGSHYPAMTKLRVFVHYPKGKEQEHTLQLLLFRQLGTWKNE